MAAKAVFLFLRTHSVRWATAWHAGCVFFIHPLSCVPVCSLAHGAFVIPIIFNSQTSADSVKTGIKRSLKAEDVRGTCTIFYKMAKSHSSELQVSRQNVLTMTLRFLLDNFNNITVTQLEKEYGFPRKNLYRFLHGKSYPRYIDDYMRVFVRILNERRKAALVSGQSDLVASIDHQLRDITLVHYGVPIDDEMELLTK